MQRNKFTRLISAGLCSAMLLSGCTSYLPEPVISEPAPLPTPIFEPAATTVKGYTVTERAVDMPSPLMIPALEGLGDFTPRPLLATETPTPTSTATASDVNLAIPRSFAITRPTEKLTTTYATYFITGTSDPDKTLYYGSQEVARLGSAGTFGVHVNLDIGENRFSFSQGGESKTVTIVRKAASTKPAPISAILQGSMVPAVSAGVKVGENLDVSCTAPAGATVTASFGGNSVTLMQPDGHSAGAPVTFKGKIPVDAAPDNSATVNSGKVLYKLSYNGNTKTFESTGDVYIAGADAYVTIKVDSYAAFVYPDTSKLHAFRAKIKKGAVDFIRSQDNEYYELSSGGFVAKDQVKVVEGGTAVSNKLSSVRAGGSGRTETYTFSGTRRPMYYTGIQDGVFTFTLYNTKGTPEASVGSSKLFSGVEVSEGSSWVTYKFAINSSRFWGYDVQFDGTDTVLSFKLKPTLAAGDAPLTGVTIMLDPGHGGTDGGASGVAGRLGPVEKDVNLAHAFAARDVLVNMGANVVMTRTQDAYVTLDERLEMIEKADADFFISIHHNSVGENTDSNKVAGMEIYYHDPLSKKSADAMMTSLVGSLNRSNRGVKQSYYRVTLMPYAPAMLLELGFMCSPVEYEKAATPKQIKLVANAIADGVKKSLS